MIPVCDAAYSYLMSKLSGIRNLTCIAALLWLTTAPAAAETRFGVEAGTSSASFDYHDYSAPIYPYSIGSRRMPSVGVSAEVSLPRRNFFALAVRYRDRVETRSASTPEFVDREEIRERTLVIAALAEGRFPLGLFLAAGPGVSYLLHRRASGTILPSLYYPTYTYTYSDDQLRHEGRTEVLLELGAGFEHAAGRHRLRITLRLDQALTSADRPPTQMQSTRRDINGLLPPIRTSARARAVELSVGAFW